MIPKNETVRPVERVLSLLENVRQGDKGWTAVAPHIAIAVAASASRKAMTVAS